MSGETVALLIATTFTLPATIYCGIAYVRSALIGGRS